jgi:hypothetical protein
MTGSWWPITDPNVLLAIGWGSAAVGAALLGLSAYLWSAPPPWDEGR